MHRYWKYIDDLPSNRGRNDNILIVDGMNMFIRNWVMNPMMNENGEHVGGVVGTLRSLSSDIRIVNPTRVIFVLDGQGGSDSRKEIDNGYKANRKTKEMRLNRQYKELLSWEEEIESMRRQFSWLIDVLRFTPVQTMVYDSVEADDVIAHISKTVKGTQMGVTISSTDKDFYQLIDNNVKIFHPTKKLIYDKDLFLKEWVLIPENLVISRALCGDPSDNLPGIKGCGHKTILKRFPEILGDNLIHPTDILKFSLERISKGAIYKNIVEGESRFLTNIRLMDLSNVILPDTIHTDINAKLNSQDTQFQRVSFIRGCDSYGILSNWSDFDKWSTVTFNNLVLK